MKRAAFILALILSVSSAAGLLARDYSLALAGDCQDEGQRLAADGPEGRPLQGLVLEIPQFQPSLRILHFQPAERSQPAQPFSLHASRVRPPPSLF